MNATLEVPVQELVELCAADTELYARTFFRDIYRQATPPFHREMDAVLEDTSKRYVGLEVFRGSAKTTKLRTWASKRIAYGVSRTVLLVGRSQGHAEDSLEWIRSQIEGNKLWASVYGLTPGKKWTREEAEIRHGAFGHVVTVLAVGITGQIRGINKDSYRPDLIVIDDPCDEENTATEEQRSKLDALIFGALQNGLAPSTECPEAKMVLAQTPLNRFDVISRCRTDPAWAHRAWGCFDERGESRWPERFPTEFLQKEQEAATRRNQFSIFAREMLCQVIPKEECAFKPEWLAYWGPMDRPLPPRYATFMSIDPTPPPSELQQAKGLIGKDYEVLTVVATDGLDYYVVDQEASKGHTPDWTIAKFFELLDKWRPMRVRVEGVAYQRTLKWVLERAMQERRRWVQVNCVTDKRAKSARIIQALSGIGSNGRLLAARTMLDLIQQWETYPMVSHDDHLDSLAMAVEEAMSIDAAIVSDDIGLPLYEPEPLPAWRSAP